MAFGSSLVFMPRTVVLETTSGVETAVGRYWGKLGSQEGLPWVLLLPR